MINWSIFALDSRTLKCLIGQEPSAICVVPWAASSRLEGMCVLRFSRWESRSRKTYLRQCYVRWLFVRGIGIRLKSPINSIFFGESTKKLYLLAAYSVYSLKYDGIVTSEPQLSIDLCLLCVGLRGCSLHLRSTWVWGQTLHQVRADPETLGTWFFPSAFAMSISVWFVLCIIGVVAPACGGGLWRRSFFQVLGVFRKLLL